MNNRMAALVRSLLFHDELRILAESVSNTDIFES